MCSTERPEPALYDMMAFISRSRELWASGQLLFVTKKDSTQIGLYLASPVVLELPLAVASTPRSGFVASSPAIRGI
jgi:hypothetical protein